MATIFRFSSAIAEAVPGYAVDGWYGICALPGAPPAVIRKVNAGVVQALKEPGVQKPLENYGLDSSSSDAKHSRLAFAPRRRSRAKAVKAALIPPQ